MKIYVCHSSSFNYEQELYGPIKRSELYTKHIFIFPHETASNTLNSQKAISTCDLVISECSYPSTGMGIELGWANKDNKRILCIYKKGSNISKSLKTISGDFIEYTDAVDLIEKLNVFINKL